MTVGEEVGFVGFAVGEGDGRAVGTAEGRLLGYCVGELDDGRVVGLFVSPSLVGRDVTGEFVGEDVGTLLVGIDVGADTIMACPTVTAAARTDAMDDFASGVNMPPTPLSAAARSNSLEKLPDDTDTVT
jgi:hypothetical protein